MLQVLYKRSTAGVTCIVCPEDALPRQRFVDLYPNNSRRRDAFEEVCIVGIDVMNSPLRPLTTPPLGLVHFEDSGLSHNNYRGPVMNRRGAILQNGTVNA